MVSMRKNLMIFSSDANFFYQSIFYLNWIQKIDSLIDFLVIDLIDIWKNWKIEGKGIIDTCSTKTH